jgi:cob(I)alamin adenosyltransferase
MLQVYTGNGKGKTTAALGLTLRAVGAGLRVFFAQFMKRAHTSELESLKQFGDRVAIKQFGTGEFIIDTPNEKDCECAEQAFAEVAAAVSSGEYGVVVADEICTALYYKLIDKDKVIGMVRACPPSIELVFTGRYAGDDVIHAAGVVTEMREVKHCFNENAPARRGIDY